MSYLPFIVAGVLSLTLVWVRRGNGGKFGKQIRYSDWLAWKDAVNEKEQELAQLRSVEPKL